MDKPKFYYGHAFVEGVPKEKQELYAKQREERGFDDTELWNLNYTLASYILPRLKAFRKLETPSSIPVEFHRTEWFNILDKMIKAFQTIVNQEFYEKDTKTTEGLALFANYFDCLWC